MILELSLLTAIYAIWILTLVNSMVSSEEISLTVATLPFIVTFPFALLLSASAEVLIPGMLFVNIGLTIVVGILLFVRWVMAIVGE
jgi:hypothetical protein